MAFFDTLGPRIFAQTFRALTAGMVLFVLLSMALLAGGCSTAYTSHLAAVDTSPRHRRPGPLATRPAAPPNAVNTAAVSGPRWFDSRLDSPDAVFAGYASPTQSSVTTYNRTGTIQTFRGLRNTGGSETTVITEQNVIRP